MSVANDMMQLDNSADRPRFAPDEAWIEEFAKQNTSELRERAKRFATRRARGVGKAGGNVDDYYVRGLAQDAFTDTLLGELAWDPAAVTLEVHIFGAIRSRTRHDRKHAKRFKHQAIDAFDASTASSAMMGEVESSLRLERDTPSPESLAYASQVIEQLRALANGDALVLRMLDAIVEGATSHVDITHVAKMSQKQYRNARERLDRLVLQLDSDVRVALRGRA